MVEEIALSLDETNKLRVQLGLKPIVAEKATPQQQQVEKPESKTIPAETVSSSFIDSSKISSFRQRLQKLSQRNINSTGDEAEDDEGWLKKVGSQKEVTPRLHVNMTYDDDDNDDDDGDDMPQLRMAHNISDLATGKDIILTLKDNNGRDNDKSDEEDVLQDENLTHFKETDKNIRLKTMNKNRRQKKMKLNVGSNDLVGSDEDGGVIKENSMLTINSTIKLGNVQNETENKTDSRGKIRVNFSDTSADDDLDIGDFKQTKIKRRKRRDGNNNITKAKTLALPIKIDNVELIDEDAGIDQDEAAEINIRRNQRSHSPNSDETFDLASKIRQEALENKKREMDIAKLHNTTHMSGLIVDETSSFLSNLDSQLLDKHNEYSAVDDDIFPSNNDQVVAPSTEETHASKDPEHVTPETTISTADEPRGSDFSGGLASTLNFLRERNVLPTKSEIPARSTDSSREELLKLKRKIELREIKEGSLKASTDNTSKRSSVHDTQSELLRNYNPDINLVYRDDQGRELTTKEAYKKLSQRFHGTKSNKKKQAKMDRHVEQRSRKQGSELRRDII